MAVSILMTRQEVIHISAAINLGFLDLLGKVSVQVALHTNTCTKYLLKVYIGKVWLENN